MASAPGCRQPTISSAWRRCRAFAKSAVIQTVSRAKDLWPTALREMDVRHAVRHEIEDRLRTLPLAGADKS